jgi:hypothetical protein
VILELRPPQGAGELTIGASRRDAFEVLKGLGDNGLAEPELLCRTPQGGWGLAARRSSGLFIAAYFKSNDRVNAIEFGRPDNTSDAITYQGLDELSSRPVDEDL